MRSSPWFVRIFIFLFATSLCAVSGGLRAQSTLIHVGGIQSMVMDHAGKHLFTASGTYNPNTSTSQTLISEYDITTGQLQASYTFGTTNPSNGIDISADDSVLLVGGGAITGGSLFYKLDLATGTSTNIVYSNPALVWVGGCGVAFTAKGTAIGMVGQTGTLGAIVEIDLVANTAKQRTDVPSSIQASSAGYVYRNVTGSVVYILAGGDGPLIYDAASDTFRLVGGQSSAQSHFGAVSRDGSLLGTTDLLTASIDRVSDSKFLRGFVTSGYGVDGGEVAFDATKDIFYAANGNGKQIIAYNTNTFAELFRLDVGESLMRTLLATDDGVHLALWLVGSSSVKIFTVPNPLPAPTPSPTPTLATRRDMIFDRSSNFLYVTTSDGLLERYNVANGNIDVLCNLGGQPNGIDIAPDDSYVLVAQGVAGIAQGVLYRINVTDGSQTQINYPLQSVDRGAWDVAIASNGIALFSAGRSGTTSSLLLRQIDLTTNAVSPRNDLPAGFYGGYIQPGAYAYRSADRSRIYILDQNNAAQAFIYEAATNSFGAKTGGGYFRWGAVSRDGRLLGSRFTESVTLDDASDLSFVHAFNDADGAVAFDATTDTVYSVSTIDREIMAHDTNTFVEKFRLDIGEAVDQALYSPTDFQIGKLVASQDGQYLAIQTPAGIKLLHVPQGPFPAPSPPVFEFSSAMVFDHAGKYLYISTLEGYLWPYNLTTNKLETPYNLGGILNGIDISPDDSFLLVGQDRNGVDEGTVHKLNLISGQASNINFHRSDYIEGGSWDVAIASNGIAFFSTGLNGSGAIPFHQIDLTTGMVSIRTDAPGPSGLIGSNTYIYSSTDRKRLLFFEPNDMAGPVFTYDATTDRFGPSNPINFVLANATGAVNRNGAIGGIDINTHGASLRSLPDFSLLQSFTTIDGGVSFDATRDVLYGVSSATSQVVAYDTNSFAELFRLNIGESVPNYSSHYEFGNMVASPDGKYLALQTPNDVRLINVATGTSVPIPPPTPTPTPTPTATPNPTPTPTPSSGPAVMTSPVPGSTFTSSSVTFQWTAGSATQYALTVGSNPQGTDIFSSGIISTHSATVNNIPVDGRTVYVTLYSKVNNAWVNNAYTYTASNGSATPTPTPTPVPTATPTPTATPVPTATPTPTATAPPTPTPSPTPTATPVPTATPTPTASPTPTPTPSSGPAVMTSPAPGSTFASSSVTFQWTAGSATQYALTLGSNPQGTDIFSSGIVTAHSATVNNIPVDGRTVYVTLYSKVGNTWVNNAYTYTASSGSSTPTPTPTATPVPTATPTPTPVPTATPTATATPVPTSTPTPSPTPVPTATPTPTPTPSSGPAIMTSPAPGSTFASSSVTFQWTAGSATQYALTVGSNPQGTDIFSSGIVTAHSATVNNIPVDGRTVYVTLYSKVGNTWLNNAYTYTASNGSATPTPTPTATPVPTATPTPTPVPTATPTPTATPVPTPTPTPSPTPVPTATPTPTPTPSSGPAVMTSPVPGSTFTSSSVTFQWTAGSATQYALTVGSNPQGIDIYSSGIISAQSATVNNIPTDGRTIYVTLYSKVNNAWVNKAYTYTAFK